MKKISGGFAKLAQLMLLVFLLPLALSVFFLMIRGSSNFSDGIFLLPFVVLVFLILKNAFSFADIYLEQEGILIKKLFYTKRQTRADISEIDSGLLPLSFYILFKDGSKIYFQSTTLDFFKSLLSFDQNSDLEQLKKKISGNP